MSGGARTKSQVHLIWTYVELYLENSGQQIQRLKISVIFCIQVVKDNVDYCFYDKSYAFTCTHALTHAQTHLEIREK